MRSFPFALLVFGCQPLTQAEPSEGDTGGMSAASSTDAGPPSPSAEAETAEPPNPPGTDSGTTGPSVGGGTTGDETTGGDKPDDGRDPDDDDTGDETSRGDQDEGGTSSGGESSTGETLPGQTFPEVSCADEATAFSPPGGNQVDVDYFNVSGEARRLYFLNGSGEREFLIEYAAEEEGYGYTFVGHLLVVTDDADQCLTIFEAAEEVGGMAHQIMLF